MRPHYKTYRAKNIVPNLIKLKDAQVDFVMFHGARINGVTPNDIKRKTRKHEIVYARHMIRWFLHKYTPLSHLQIVCETGGINHSTSIHSIITCEDLVETDKTYRHRFNELHAIVKQRLLPVPKISFKH